jgi:hypothetical protein
MLCMKTNSIHSLVVILFLLGSLLNSGYTPAKTRASLAAGNIGSCQVFPANNFWNVPVDNLPVDPNSAKWINSIGASGTFHMDFGSGTWDGGPIGIPYNVLSGSDPSVTPYNVDFYYPDESDPGPYPLPPSPKIEWGGDHHILTVDTDDCKLYEIFDASFDGTQWSGGSGAIWDMDLNDLRPNTWTSADAAGLPILPGLARYNEVSAGVIEHALRFTANCTANYYIWPARHKAQHGSCATPVPFGARFRLKTGYDISGFSPQAQVLLQAFKTYGIVLADNGSDWYVSGSPSPSWDNDQLHELDVLSGSDFEAVDTSGLMVSQNSAATNHSDTPHVYSIKRMDANPTSASTFRYKVYFSEPVTGVDAADFALAATGDITGETLSDVSGSGISYIVTTAISGGYGTLQLKLVDDNSILDDLNNPLGGVSVGDGDYTNGQSYTRIATTILTAASNGTNDGWILESSETSGTGGAMNAATATFNLGDDAADRQYRAILSFNTYNLPDNATIIKVTLKVKRNGVIGGGDPLNIFQGLKVDIKKGIFGASALELGDFKATAGKSYGPFSPFLSSSWYSLNLTNGKGYINTMGNTQIRLRFSLDDNNNGVANFLKLYSGNATTIDRPQLVIEYYVS